MSTGCSSGLRSVSFSPQPILRSSCQQVTSPATPLRAWRARIGEPGRRAYLATTFISLSTVAAIFYRCDVGVVATLVSSLDLCLLRNDKPEIRWKTARGALQGARLVIPQAWNRGAWAGLAGIRVAGLPIVPSSRDRPQRRRAFALYGQAPMYRVRQVPLARSSCSAGLRASTARTIRPYRFGRPKKLSHRTSAGQFLNLTRAPDVKSCPTGVL